MANHEHAQGQCPNCGRNEIEADRRYGNKLKGREFLRQVFRSPIYWIGFALVVLPGFFLGPVATDQIAWRYGLSALVADLNKRINSRFKKMAKRKLMAADLLLVCDFVFVTA